LKPRAAAVPASSPGSAGPRIPPPVSRALHRFAVVLAGAVVLLIAAGALVKSKEAGLSVPDWPLSYGSLNPPRWWQIDTVRSEHGHRLFAGTVAALTVALAVWAGRSERRRWVRRIAWLAVAAVVAQALLGGITVLLFLPPAVSIAHAGLAQVFLCLVVTLAVVTSRGWWGSEAASPAIATPAAGPAGSGEAAGLRALAGLTRATAAAVYGQILLGALVRHTGAGLAIPDFPLAFGRLVPPRFDFLVGVHYAHRLGALAVAGLVAWCLARVWARHRAEPALLWPSAAMGLLVLVQVALGAAIVLTRRAVVPNTFHVATGAALLAASLVLALHAGRLANRAAAASLAEAAGAARSGRAGEGGRRAAAREALS
jgi:heme a synthase